MELEKRQLMPRAEAEEWAKQYGHLKIAQVPDGALTKLLEAMAVLGELVYHGHDESGQPVYSLPEDA